MKFCFVTTFFPPYHFGGDAVAVAHLANALVRSGHDVLVVHCVDAFRLLRKNVDPSPFPLDSRVRVRALQSQWGVLSPILTYASGKPVLKRRELSDILSDNFDVIHWHNISLVSGPGGFHYGGGVQLCTLHDYWLMCPTSLLFKNNREPCEKPECTLCSLAYRRMPQFWRGSRLLENGIRRIDRFLAPSKFVRNRFQKSGLGIDATVVPHFLPETPSSEQVVTGSYYLFVGRIEKHKGLHTILSLFAGTSRRLVIAGAGNAEPELRRLSKDLPGVKFLGRIPYEELPRLYAGARATLLPSLSPETFGLTVLESLEQGTPVVAREIGALPETISKTGGGLLYRTTEDLREILDRLDSDATLRNELGRRGHANLGGYRPDVFLKRYFEIIDEERAREDRTGRGATHAQERLLSRSRSR